MIRPTLEERITELERLNQRLEERIADLEGKTWVQTGTAADMLYISQNGLNYRINKFPHIYPEGKVWRWSQTGDRRLINVKAWKQADSDWAQARYQRMDKSKILKRDHSRRKKA